MNINKSLSNVSKKVYEYLNAEHITGGLLEDVNMIIPVSENDTPIDEPCIWIVQHPTILDSTKKSLGRVNSLITPFEFVCIVYNPDLQESHRVGQDIATLVGVSIQKNFMKNNTDDDGRRVFQTVEFQEFRPVGEVEIEGKSEKLTATSIIFNFKHEIDWLKCCKNTAQQINE